MPDMEYVIYVRKSTDESSGQQTQSIPDQINKCVRYAEQNDLVIRTKPKDFEFETEGDIIKEDNDPENSDIFKQTRGLYIIKEQQSAKVPWLRPKRKKLISMIKHWKIKWLLSYSPDRQCRNMLEWGELIDCVDNWLIDLKYTNFHFENTASGKMMLGIRFVFSKQYSDKLSEDITRWKKSSVEKWKSQWRYKYGYYRDPEDGYYKPHEKYFPLMKEAFQMKLYMGASDEYIANRLNANEYFRENKKETKAVSAKMLYMVWTDDFYYGIYIYGDSIVDMRVMNPHYQPMISEDEHDILMTRSKQKSKQTLLSAKEDRYADVRPLPKGILKVQDGSSFTPYIAAVSRLKTRLATVQKKHPEFEMKDVVLPHQIRYRIMNKFSKLYQLEVTFDIVDKAVCDLFSKIKVNTKDFDEMIAVISDKIDAMNRENKEKYNKTVLRLNRVKSKKMDFIKHNLWAKRGKDEQSVYDVEIRKFDAEISLVQKELSAINEDERNSLVEFEMLVDTLRKSGSLYEKASYVRKRTLISLFVSNIYVSKQKGFTIEVKPDLLHFFSLSGSGEIRTRV